MGDEYLPASDAADLLGVKRETLYAYVSRGWLESIPDPTSNRARLYRRSDLDRLRSRSDARKGDAPVAAGALRWGAPVLQTRVGTVTPQGPAYRGHLLTSLRGRSFERVAELLWTEELPDETTWPVQTAEPSTLDVAPIDAIRLAVLRHELTDPRRDVRTELATLQQARSLLDAMAVALGASPHDRFATRVVEALGADPDATDAIDVALVICADHELNASTFAARVAASTGANLYAAVGAALAAFVGPKHGAAAQRVRRLVQECARGPRTVLLERLAAGESIPGFGHPLYEHGDPRFNMLWAAAERVDPSRLEPLRAVLETAAELGLEPPHLDVGLVALATACDLRDGAESALFALGRTAGWIAHAREQMGQDFLLRPRADYVGPDPV